MTCPETTACGLDPVRAQALEIVLDRIQATELYRKALIQAYQASPGLGWQRASTTWCEWTRALAEGGPAFHHQMILHPNPPHHQWMGPLWAHPEEMAPGWRETEPGAPSSLHVPLFVVAFLLGQWDVCEQIWTTGEDPSVEWVSFLILTLPVRTPTGALAWSIPALWKDRLLNCLSPDRAGRLGRALILRLCGDVTDAPHLHDAQHAWLPQLVALSDQSDLRDLFAAVQPLWRVNAAADEHRWVDLLTLLDRRPGTGPSLRHVVSRLYAEGEVSLFCALAECNHWALPELTQGMMAWKAMTAHPSAQDWKWWRARLRAIQVPAEAREALWAQVQPVSPGAAPMVNPLLD